MKKNGKAETTIEVQINAERIKREKAVRDDIQAFVEKAKVNGKVFDDMVEDYMFFWNTKEDLKENVRQNGVKETYCNGANQYGERINQSIDKIKMVEFEMRKIRAEIGYTVSAVAEEEIDEL